MRALHLALACETGDDSDPSPYFTVGGVLSEQEASELMGRLDRDRDGRVSWEGFVEYFADAVHGEEGGGRGGGHPESWFQLEVDIAEKLLQHMEAQGGSTARRAWVNSLRRRFQTADISETGTLDRYVTCNTFFYLPFRTFHPPDLCRGKPGPTPHTPPSATHVPPSLLPLRLTILSFLFSSFPPCPLSTCRSSYPPLYLVSIIFGVWLVTCVAVERRDEFFRSLRCMHVSLSAREGERLFLSLLPTTADPTRGARYPELVDFLRCKNAKWYDVESGIADKVSSCFC